MKKIIFIIFTAFAVNIIAKVSNNSDDGEETDTLKTLISSWKKNQQ